MTKEELQKLDDDLAKEEKLLVNQLNVIANIDPSSKTSFTTRVPNYDDGDHDEDDYGKCDNCSLRIEDGRLKVLPIANLCMSCAKNNK